MTMSIRESLVRHTLLGKMAHRIDYPRPGSRAAGTASVPTLDHCHADLSEIPPHSFSRGGHRLELMLGKENHLEGGIE
jgi:hypothetical protein